MGGEDVDDNCLRAVLQSIHILAIARRNEMVIVSRVNNPNIDLSGMTRCAREVITEQLLNRFGDNLDSRDLERTLMVAEKLIEEAVSEMLSAGAEPDRITSEVLAEHALQVLLDLS